MGTRLSPERKAVSEESRTVHIQLSPALLSFCTSQELCHSPRIHTFLGATCQHLCPGSSASCPYPFPSAQFHANTPLPELCPVSTQPCQPAGSHTYWSPPSWPSVSQDPHFAQLLTAPLPSHSLPRPMFFLPMRYFQNRVHFWADCILGSSCFSQLWFLSGLIPVKWIAQHEISSINKKVGKDL